MLRTMVGEGPGRGVPFSPYSLVPVRHVIPTFYYAVPFFFLASLVIRAFYFLVVDSVLLLPGRHSVTASSPPRLDLIFGLR